MHNTHANMHLASPCTHCRLSRPQESRDNGDRNFLRLACSVVVVVVVALLVDHHDLFSRMFFLLHVLNHGHIIFGGRHFQCIVYLQLMLFIVCSGGILLIWQLVAGWRPHRPHSRATLGYFDYRCRSSRLFSTRERLYQISNRDQQNHYRDQFLCVNPLKVIMKL